MKKIFLVLLLILAFGAFDVSISHASLGGYEITNYDVKMKVTKANIYEITEIIDVNFLEERHGIIRNIPTKYDNQRIWVKNISIPDYKYKLEKRSNDILIRIGDPDKTVTGIHTYEISYTYDVGEDGIREYDELYFNIIGDQWDAIIEKVTFEIEMPGEFDTDNLNFTMGVRGSTDNSGVYYDVSGNVIKGETSRQLNPQEALTIALNLPEGYYYEVSKRFYDYLFSHNVLYGLVVLFIILSLIIWNKFGRDEKLFPTVEFDPPDNLDPVEIGYVIDEVVNEKDITSILIYWAEKGYITIEEQGGYNDDIKKSSVILIKEKDLNHDAKPYEKKLFDALFVTYGDGAKVRIKDLQYKFADTFSEIVRDAGLYIKKNTENLFSKRSDRVSWIPFAFNYLVFLFVTLKAYFAGYTTANFLVTIGLPFVFSLPSVTLRLMAGRWRFADVEGKAWICCSILVVSAFITIFSLAFFEGQVFQDFFVALFTSLVIGIISALTRKLTEYGRNIKSKSLGFKNFLIDVEKEKLEQMIDSNPGYFYNVLPYTMVLGVSDKWVDKFEGLNIQAPRWYRTQYRHGRFSVRDFDRSLNSSIISMRSTMNSRPPNTGSGRRSSFGGSSGGGRGGGGGGSW